MTGLDAASAMDHSAGAVETRRRRSYSGPLRRVCSIGYLSLTNSLMRFAAKKGGHIQYQSSSLTESRSEALPKERTLGNAQSNDGRGASAVQRAKSLHLSGELQ